MHHALESTPDNQVPLGGQTLMNTKNDHLEYALTW